MANVTIYTTPTCPWCMKTKEFFKANDVKYTEVDVSADAEKAEKMIEKSGQMGVPVTDIDGQIVIGFDKDRLSELLKIK